MKYLNGNWLVRDGFAIDYGQSIYDSEIKDDKLTLWVPFKVITNPGMTLDDGMLTLEIILFALRLLILKAPLITVLNLI